VVVDKGLKMRKSGFIIEHGLWGFVGSHESSNGSDAHTESGEESKAFSALSSLGLRSLEH